MRREPAPSDSGGLPLQPPGPVVTIDEPKADSQLPQDFVPVRGWALVDGSLAARVEVLVDGSQAGFARLGLARPDVADQFAAARAVASGYEFLLDLTNFQTTSHEAASIEVSVRAYRRGSHHPAVSVSTSLEVAQINDTNGASSPGGPSGLPTDGEAVSPAASAPPGQSGRGRLQLPRRARSSRFRRRRNSRSTKSSPTPRKLAAFTHSLGLGGAQLWLTELLRQTEAGREFDCTVIACESGPLQSELEALGMDVRVSPQSSWSDPAAYDAKVRQLAARLGEGGYGAVLANTFLSLEGADAGVLAGLPVAWAIHESWPPAAIWPYFFTHGEVDPAVKRRFCEVAASVSALVFAAEGTRELYEPITSEGNSIVVPHGVDLAGIDRYRDGVSRSQARSALGLDPQHRLLLAIGTVEPRKGQSLLVSAFAELAQSHPDAHLAIVGALDTPYTDGLRSLVRAVGVDDRVSILPVVEDPDPWYRAADVLVSASDVESLPRTMLEAMAFGVPVLATGIFGVSELVEDGLNGWLYPPCDTEALLYSLRWVLEASDAELAEVGERGRATVREAFDSSHYAKDVLTILDRIPATTLAQVFSGHGAAPACRFSLGKEAARAWAGTPTG